MKIIVDFEKRKAGLPWGPHRRKMFILLPRLVGDMKGEDGFDVEEV